MSAIMVFAASLAACSQSSAGPAADPVLAKEQAAVAPLKDKYKDVVTGTDVKDATLIVYVDVNSMYSMDEDAEAAMKADALGRWKSVWISTHPRKHAVLHLSLRDYYGKEVYASSASI